MLIGTTLALVFTLSTLAQTVSAPPALPRPVQSLPVVITEAQMTTVLAAVAAKVPPPSGYAVVGVLLNNANTNHPTAFIQVKATAPVMTQ